MSDSTENRDLRHLLTLARRGKYAGSSGGEKQARAIVLAILNNVIGLDGSATAGINCLIELIQASPQDGAELVRDTIVLKRRVSS